MILFINDIQIESLAKPIAQTLQVNSILNLSDRQSSFTNSFEFPKTSNNKRALSFLSLQNNQSNIPYQKNECSLYSEKGECFIYKGWAVISETANNYKCNVYSGIIDIYKAIENKTFKDCDLTALNHVKNTASVLASFDNSKPYLYIISDYNGKTLTTTAPNANKMNIDYLIPSVKVSYLMDRIALLSGFTFIGDVFEREDYLNLYLTYPKPVPNTDLVVEEVTDQIGNVTTRLEPFPNGNGIEYITIYSYNVFPNSFTNQFGTNVFNGSPANRIRFTRIGSYRIKTTGLGNQGNNPIFNYAHTDINNNVKSTGNFPGNGVKEVVFNVEVGDQISMQALFFFNNTPFNFRTEVDFLVGANVDFSSALFDFSLKDFFKEILQRFAITIIPDKYEKILTFATLDNIVENDFIDWSNKFPKKLSEKYIIGGYAQRNFFKYKYNEPEENHNDGFIPLPNQNLEDQVTVLTSKIYSPEKNKILVFGVQSNVYKFWDKQIKDNNTVEYKELSGRYYFLRARQFTETIPFASEVLNETGSATSIYREDYSRLNFQQIIFDNYNHITDIFDKAKIVEAEVWLKDRDIETFDFKRLVYIKQFGGYYLVDKIKKYIPDKITKCDILEVDYLGVRYEEPITNTYIRIASIVANVCIATITLDTDIVLPAIITLNITRLGSYNLPDGTPVDFALENYTEVLFFETLTKQITFRIGGRYRIFAQFNDGLRSANFEFNNVSSCAIAPNPGTFLTITNITTLSVINNRRSIKIFFDTDFPKPMNISVGQFVRVDLGSTIIELEYVTSVNDNFVIVSIVHSGIQTPGGPMLPYPYDIVLRAGNLPIIQSNIFPNNG